LAKRYALSRLSTIRLSARDKATHTASLDCFAFGSQWRRQGSGRHREARSAVTIQRTIPEWIASPPARNDG